MQVPLGGNQSQFAEQPAFRKQLQEIRYSKTSKRIFPEHPLGVST